MTNPKYPNTLRGSMDAITEAIKQANVSIDLSTDEIMSTLMIVMELSDCWVLTDGEWRGPERDVGSGPYGKTI